MALSFYSSANKLNFVKNKVLILPKKSFKFREKKFLNFVKKKFLNFILKVLKLKQVAGKPLNLYFLQKLLLKLVYYSLFH